VVSLIFPGTDHPKRLDGQIVVITGGKCLQSINAAWHNLKSKLQGFLRPTLHKAETNKKRKCVHAAA